MSKKLPIVIPIVIYHGKQKWDIEKSLAHLLDSDEDTQKYIPDFKSEVFDISHIPDDEIKGEILLRVHFMVQKYIDSPHIFDKLDTIFKMLVTISEKNKKTELLETLLRYLVATIDNSQMQELKTHIKKAVENGGRLMPTIAEKWVQEGIEQGIEQGIEKGIEQGKFESALKMIQMDMNDEDIRKITGLSAVKILQLRKQVKTGKKNK